MEEDIMKYKQMVEDINQIVDNDWASEMELKLLPESSKYTQQEAKDMAIAIGQVYKISHGIYCICGFKYGRKESKEDKRIDGAMMKLQKETYETKTKG